MSVSGHDRDHSAQKMSRTRPPAYSASAASQNMSVAQRNVATGCSGAAKITASGQKACGANSMTSWSARAARAGILIEIDRAASMSAAAQRWRRAARLIPTTRRTPAAGSRFARSAPKTASSASAERARSVAALRHGLRHRRRPRHPLHRAAARPGSTDLALHAETVASSTEGSGYAATFATDGDETTRWGSAFADAQWLQVRLTAPHVLHSISVLWEVARPEGYRVQVPAPGADASWAEIAAVKRIRATAFPAWVTTPLPPGTVAATVRLYAPRRATSLASRASPSTCAARPSARRARRHRRRRGGRRTRRRRRGGCLGRGRRRLGPRAAAAVRASAARVPHGQGALRGGREPSPPHAAPQHPRPAAAAAPARAAAVAAAAAAAPVATGRPLEILSGRRPSHPRRRRRRCRLRPRRAPQQCSPRRRTSLRPYSSSSRASASASSFSSV